MNVLSEKYRVVAVAWVLLTSAAANAVAAESETLFDVEASASQFMGHVDCSYRLTNHSQKSIVGFIVGAGEQANGPYELPVTPVGVHSPRGWEFSVFSPDPNQHLAVEWQTKSAERALMPGQSLEALTIRYDSRDMPCNGVYWTVIDRDSELFSGSID